MPQRADKQYSHDHEVGPDGSVTFHCSDDIEKWPFLELAPHHPIVIHTINFWISVECSIARGTFDPDKWSALTWMDWECLDPEAGHAARGVMENVEIDGKLGFAMKLFDARDRPYCNIRGRGVVFRTRNFEGWREDTKNAVVANRSAAPFVYAPRDEVGVEERELSLISPLEGVASARGLITKENGMPPASRYLSGSGDHVNAVHIAEAARQFAALKTGDPKVRFSGGEVSFDHYVELGAPFELALAGESEGAIDLKLTQAGHDCTSIALRIA